MARNPSEPTWWERLVSRLERRFSKDTTPPSPPSGLQGSYSPTTSIATLTWTAASDNRAVKAYKILRNGNPIGFATGTSYQDPQPPAALQTYAVHALDTAGNLSAAATVQVNTSPVDTTAPTTPALSVTQATQSAISLSWTASTDDIGVTDYILEKATNSGFTAGLTTLQAGGLTRTYNDVNLSANTTYWYRVRARDAAGNLSNYATTSATTQPAPVGAVYWLHNPANGLVSSIPAATHRLFADSILTTVDGRAAIRTTVNDVQGNRGLEMLVNHQPIGAPFGRSLFFRFWIKFDANYTLGSVGERKWKIGRIGNPNGCCTFYLWPDKWQMSELIDGWNYDQYDKTVLCNLNPQSDTTLRNWNEFILEVQYPTSTAVKNDSIFRVYRNGVLIGSSSQSQWFNLNNDHVTQWGGVMSRIYPQMNSGGTSGGYVYIGETSITDYFYSTAG